MKSKLIALSAISASFITIVLSLGAYIELIDMASIVIASVFVLMPLYYKSYLGSFLSYLAGGLLAFIISGFNFYSLVFVGYFGLFGLYPIVNFLFKEKSLNKYAAFIIKFIWFVGGMIGLYFYYTAFYGLDLSENLEFLRPYVLLIYSVFSVGFYFVFDYAINKLKRIIDYYLNRIIK